MAGTPALPPALTGNRFRQRKISTKQTLQILKQSQLSDVDNADLQQRDLQEIETGVEKNEEEEVHLKKILKKTGITSTSDAYIPTPDASKVWDEAKKYYKGTFKEPTSYIKSSAHVEDYLTNCNYCMDEVDEEFLTKFNESLVSSSSSKKDKEKDKSGNNKQLTEDEFEILMDRFEKVINEKQPFLITDPENILELSEIKVAVTKLDETSKSQIYKKIEQDLQVKNFKTLLDGDPQVAKNLPPNNSRPISEIVELYGEEIYSHFKKRKIERLGKSIIPSLKFTGEDDNDPYMCFRQRQFRSQRKTRRADVQSSEKLLKLYNELKLTKELVVLVFERERKRLSSLQVDNEVFDLRCKVKNLKRELGINDSDEDLINHKKKKPLPNLSLSSNGSMEEKTRKQGLSKLGNNANTDKSKHGGSNQDLTGSDLNGSAGGSGVAGNASGSGSNNNQQQAFQPYVKLPPSKIPDMDLETVQHVLNNKDLSMQKFVEEKLKKRKISDIGFINLTDEPFNPFFQINTSSEKLLDKSHTPYSSITTSSFDVESLGYNPNINKYIERGYVNGGDSMLFNFDNNKKREKFSPEKYDALYSKQVLTSDAKMSLRKRVGRCGIVYIDRKNMIKKINDNDDNDDSYSYSFRNSNGNGVGSEVMGGQAEDEEMTQEEAKEIKERFEDRWKYDSEIGLFDYDNEPFSDDPSRLNSISNETQVIRFGGMLVSKAYETLKEAMMNHRQQLYYQQLQRLQQQQQRAAQLAGAQNANSNGSSNGSSNNPSQNSNQNSGQNPSQNPSQKLAGSSTVQRVGTPIKTEN